MTPEQALKKWEESPFYTNQIVLGIDIGIGGIGVYIRKGPRCVFARTYMVTLPESAPLRSRRLKRAMRRSRASLRHRDFLFRQWCKEYGVPVVEGDAKARSDAWSLRYRAATQGVASAEAMSVCLRHILGRRGFSYHRDNDDLLQPWGETTDHASVRRWLNSACFDKKFGDNLLRQLDEHDWVRRNGELTERGREIAELVQERIRYFDSNPLLGHIKRHIGAPAHIRAKAWDENFPRDLIEQHAAEIIDKHARFFGMRAEEAKRAYLDILNYARNEAGALADRKVKRCPYYARLKPGAELKSPRCAKGTDFAVRHMNLIEFLAQRPVIDEMGERHLANESLYNLCLDHLRVDTAAIEAKAPRPKLGRELRKHVAECLGCSPASNKDCPPNEHWFDQLKDLLMPRLSSLAGRANCCGEAAQILVDRAMAKGWAGVQLTDSWAEFFDWRRDTERGYGLYPQVEMLLGRRSASGKQVIPGMLRRVFAELEPELGQDTPDVVITEVIRSAARNSEERKERDRDLKQRRAEMDSIYQKHGLEEGGSHADRVRVDLFVQQGGRCPYTGEDLKNPLNPALQIDHIYPREMGGVSERYNLVLTTAKTNKLKGKRTPHQAKTDFPDYEAHAKKMKWPRNKLELFLRRELNLPEWNNLTRTSQLARELRDAVIHWLGIKNNPEAIRVRIGTPSGLQTAQCRRSASWRSKLPEVDGKKDRDNLRHHLWDAAVISHIPPAEGLQSVHNGGIFYPVAPSKAGDLGWEALDLGPDLNAFEEATKEQCLVIKPRPRKPKQKRTEETIYGRREDGQLIVRKPIITGQGLVDKNAGKWLAASGIPAKLLTKAKLSSFLEQDKDAKPLVLSNGTRVNSVRTEAPSESPITLLPHRNRQRQIIGWKIMNSPYARLEIWLAPEPDKKGRPIFQRRFVPNPRGLASLHRMAKDGLAPWWSKRDAKGNSLRREIVGEPLKPYSKLVCSVRLGDLLRVPYDAHGAVCEPAWDRANRSFKCDKAVHWAWLRVTSIMSSGQIETIMAEKPANDFIKATKPAATATVAAFRLFGDLAKKH